MFSRKHVNGLLGFLLASALLVALVALGERLPSLVNPIAALVLGSVAIGTAVAAAQAKLYIVIVASLRKQDDPESAKQAFSKAVCEPVALGVGVAFLTAFAASVPWNENPILALAVVGTAAACTWLGTLLGTAVAIAVHKRQMTRLFEKELAATGKPAGK